MDEGFGLVGSWSPSAIGGDFQVLPLLELFEPAFAMGLVGNVVTPLMILYEFEDVSRLRFGVR